AILSPHGPLHHASHGPPPPLRRGGSKVAADRSVRSSPVYGGGGPPKAVEGAEISGSRICDNHPAPPILSSAPFSPSAVCVAATMMPPSSRCASISARNCRSEAASRPAVGSSSSQIGL